MDLSVADKGMVGFGPFQLDSVRRRLTRDGDAIKLSAKQFDVLLYFVANPNRIIEKDELLAAVWPGRFVEESNLTQTVYLLRRALQANDNERYIVTAAGRGYRFVGEVVPVPVVTSASSTACDTGDLPSRGAAVAPAPEPRPSTGRLPVVPSSPRRWFFALGGVAAAGACLLAVFLLPRASHLPAAPPRLSVVVLPFRSLGDDAPRNDLADAITDDLTTDLSHMPGSLVIARTTAEAYRGRPTPADEIGRALNVRYVLEGSIRAVQGSLRVDAQLIDAATNIQIWAEQYDSGTARTWEAQSDIVRHIASALDIVLVHEEVVRAARERPSNPDALDLFFRARSVIDRGDSLERMSEAQNYLERAIAAEPDFVDALSTLGFLLGRKLFNYNYPGYFRDSDEADRVTSHALSLAPNNSAALAARGEVLSYRAGCADAKPLFDAALANEPSDIWALAGTANCAWETGDLEKAGSALQSLLHVDPQGPAIASRYRMLGLAALFEGQFHQAVQFLLQSERDATTSPPMAARVTPSDATQLYLAVAYAMAGDVAEARRRYESFRILWPHRSVWRQMAFFNEAQSRLPRFGQIADAMHAAGMPRFADEHEDDHVPPSVMPLSGGDFTPTPVAIPGANVIDTKSLASLLSTGKPVLVLDVGRAIALVPGALELSDADAALDRKGLEATPIGARLRAASGAPIVVVGTGTFGINSYNTVLRLLALGYRNLYWYRGGEEAWVANGMPAKDGRAN